MAPFAGKTVLARAQSAVNNKTAPAARSHNDAKDAVVALACAPSATGMGCRCLAKTSPLSESSTASVFVPPTDQSQASAWGVQLRRLLRCTLKRIGSATRAGVDHLARQAVLKQFTKAF
jgi:hypothetical protein